MNNLKQFKNTLIITTLLCVAPILIGIIMWKQLPDMMPVHFDINNEPDGYMKKWIAVFVLPIGVALLEWVCIIVSSLDPKKGNISAKALKVVLWIMPVISWLCSLMTYSYALGYRLNIGSIVLVFLGILFVGIGNYLPKNKLNYSFGNRTPWALNDEENWTYSNRIAGISFSISGLIVIVLAVLGFFFPTHKILYILALVIIIIAAFIPIIASYLHYRNKLKEKGDNSEK